MNDEIQVLPKKLLKPILKNNLIDISSQTKNEANDSKKNIKFRK